RRVGRPAGGLRPRGPVRCALRWARRGADAELYLRLEGDRSHPILAGLEEAERIINGVYRVEVEPTEKLATAPLTLVPSYPDLPMEEVYPRVPKTEIAEVYLREAGKGRVVYFPWDIDRTFWE